MPIIQSRRRFIAGLGSLFAAPAIVKYSSLMPVKIVDDPFSDIGIFYCPYIPPLTIEKLTVIARSRQLSATWAFETHDNLKDNRVISPHYNY